MGCGYTQTVFFPNLCFCSVALGLTVASAAHEWLVEVTFKLSSSVPIDVFMSSSGGILF